MIRGQNGPVQWRNIGQRCHFGANLDSNCIARRKLRRISLQRAILEESKGPIVQLRDKDHGRQLVPDAAINVDSTRVSKANAERSASLSRRRRDRLLYDLKQGRSSEWEVDHYFRDLIQAKSYEEVLETWTDWKDILKSGTKDARLHVSRTFVLVAHVCISLARRQTTDSHSITELLRPMRPPKASSQTQDLVDGLALPEAEHAAVKQTISLCDKAGLTPNSEAFLNGLQNLVIKYNAEALYSLYKRAVDGTEQLSEETYNRFAEGFLAVARPQYARQVLNDMQNAQKQILPSLWSKLLAHVGRMQDLTSVDALWRDIQERTTPDTTIYTALLEAYFKCGQVDSALETLHAMSKTKATLPNSVTCNVVVKGLVDNGRVTEAIRFVEESAIPAGMKPDVTTCNILLKACLQNEDSGHLKTVMNYMKAVGSRDAATYTILASRFSIDDMTVVEYTKKFEAVLAQMAREQIRPNAYLYSSVMNNILFSKKDRKALPSRDASLQAQIWLQDMKHQNIPRTIIVYEVLLRGFLRASNIDSAFELWNEMRRDRVSPDAGAYHTMIRGLTAAGKLQSALQVLEKSIESQIRRDHTLLVLINAALARQDRTCVRTLISMLQRHGWTQHSDTVRQELDRAAQFVGYVRFPN